MQPLIHSSVNGRACACGIMTMTLVTKRMTLKKNFIFSGAMYVCPSVCFAIKFFQNTRGIEATHNSERGGGL